MMVVVADNEHPREHDPAAPPPAVREPTEITPDQVRQFQEFQRFQELMREQAEKGFPPGNPPPGLLQPWGPPPPKESLGKRLLKSAISKIVTGLVVLAILIFSAFILYDLKRVQDGHETNYITATLGVYLSIYNVFQSLLALFGIAGGRDE